MSTDVLQDRVGATGFTASTIAIQGGVLLRQDDGGLPVGGVQAAAAAVEAGQDVPELGPEALGQRPRLAQAGLVRGGVQIPMTYQGHQKGKNIDFLKLQFGPQWLIRLVSRGVRQCKMTGLMCPSFCSAELPGRPILKAIGGVFFCFEKILLFVPPWWPWYVLGQSGADVGHRIVPRPSRREGQRRLPRSG
jgi:hypothetical protein